MYNETQPATAEARRLKKRELDRKAQRLARERTKSRIAQLENMVDNLRQNDSNSHIATLMDQLGQVTKERDNLLQVLDSLGSTIRRHIGDSTTNEPASDASESSPQISRGVMHPPMGERIVPVTVRALSETSGSTLLELPMDPPQSSPFAYDSWTHSASTNQYPTTLAYDNTMLPPEASYMPIQPFLPEMTPSTPEEADVIIPKSPIPCHCSNPTSCTSTFHSANANIWRAVNEILQKPTRLSEEELAIEMYGGEDIAVRAVLEGWDSVESSGRMTPTWRKLRSADELCFSRCADTERLAVMRICHLLLIYHGDPTLARRETVPRWYWNRPSQALPHSYGIDFFVWPGLRERLIFSQHHYCTNTFWDLLQSNLKILWQDGFQDTFYHNAHTGKYQISPIFEQRIRDINSWTMSTDFFAHFPELNQDIPAFMGIPPSVEEMHSRAIIPTGQRRRQSEADTKDVKGQRATIC
ncbi:Ff.00g001620.m01.CDS01 [Fusarium sp. VM40]|nr:Ff.00g001620.m01.CDS01 [Fusarium sp. VM40]